jgi:hypothetical protein
MISIKMSSGVLEKEILMATQMISGVKIYRKCKSRFFSGGMSIIII